MSDDDDNDDDDDNVTRDESSRFPSLILTNKHYKNDCEVSYPGMLPDARRINTIK